MDADQLSERLDYYRERVRLERAAALTATCPEAQSVHLQLADLYEEVVLHGGAFKPLPPDTPVSQPLIVLTSD